MTSMIRIIVLLVTILIPITFAHAYEAKELRRATYGMHFDMFVQYDGEDAGFLMIRNKSSEHLRANICVYKWGCDDVLERGICSGDIKFDSEHPEKYVGANGHMNKEFYNLIVNGYNAKLRLKPGEVRPLCLPPCADSSTKRTNYRVNQLVLVFEFEHEAMEFEQAVKKAMPHFWGFK